MAKKLQTLDALQCVSTIQNLYFMFNHNKISDSELRNKIKNGEICFGGNQKLKIYGTLKCSSGKRMKRENRVFFLSENEAKQNGFRPCGHCMKTEYLKWKNGLI